MNYVDEKKFLKCSLRLLDNQYVRQPACYFSFAIVAIFFVNILASSTTHFWRDPIIVYVRSLSS